MKKEIKGSKEINLSHDLSGKVNFRKERKERQELNEYQFQQTVLTNLKTA